MRLRYAYFITCREAVKDPATGEVVELRCTYDPETRGGYAPDGRKVRGTIHWVSALHAIEAEVRLYDHLFTRVNPEDAGEGGDYKDALNPASLETLAGCRVEPSLRGAPAGSRYQFERQGYFCVDPDSTGGRLVVNRTVTLRDTWAKIEKAQQARRPAEQCGHHDSQPGRRWRYALSTFSMTRLRQSGSSRKYTPLPFPGPLRT